MKIDPSPFVLGDPKNALDRGPLCDVVVVPAKGCRLQQSDSPDGPWRRCGKVPTKRYVRPVVNP